MSGAPPAVRLFAALEPGPVLRAALEQWGRDAAAADRALRAVAGSALHVTLHFLGERPAADVPALRAAVAAAAQDPVTLETAGALWLAPRRPHVLTCAVRDVEGHLEGLHRALGAALAAATPGWEPERRPLRAHVTVARVRRGERPRAGNVAAAPAVREGALAVALVASRLAPGGAVHETLERRPLRRVS